MKVRQSRPEMFSSDCVSVFEAASLILMKVTKKNLKLWKDSN